ncbi:MAG: hypothetical protein IKQ45_00465 [Clostridia bacterium]|nr:hypothetical protein [Clostridia bacterium]
MNELLGGMELNEMGENSATREIASQLQAYQSRLFEAMKAGDAETANYFRGQIEKLNEEMGASQGTAAGVGAENASGIPGYHPEQLKAAQDRLTNAKRELSALEHQRKGRTDDPALEKLISKKAQEVQKLEREYKRTQYYNRPRLRGEDEGIDTPQGAKEAVKQGARQGSKGQEISFGGGAGVTEIIHSRGSMKISEANSKRSTASSYESSARRARNEGNFSKASSLESTARSLRSEANKLETEGKNLRAYKPK